MSKECTVQFVVKFVAKDNFTTKLYNFVGKINFVTKVNFATLVAKLTVQ